MQEDIAFFAKTNFRNQERVFGIKTDDRRRHMYVIGKTGMGKTNLLENLVIQDIQKGHGVAFIDPHGDTAEKLIKAIPANRINDVIYFNPSDQDFPIAFNVMEKVGPEYRHLVASGLVGVFKKIWADSWGPRLEYILRNAIMALLEYPGSTLLGVTRILVDKSYREKVVEKVTDPVVKSFWVDEFSKWNDRVLQEVISPIQNKVGQFLSSALIRNIVGQTVSSFDVREAMDSRKILIMNLSKGRIGEDNSALLGAMMITKIQLAAMGRVDMPEEERSDFYLYVDEFQNFATESFANILSEARKYHLNLVLANQYVTQIDEKVRDAIFGNAGTLISFRVGATDAEFLEKEFDPVFLMNDIVNLPKYHIYLKLMIDGIAGDAFSAVSLAPIQIDHTRENEEKVIRISRERYASDKTEVEDKIRRWSGMLTEEEKMALYQRPGVAPQGNTRAYASRPTQNQVSDSRRDANHSASSIPRQSSGVSRPFSGTPSAEKPRIIVQSEGVSKPFSGTLPIEKVETKVSSIPVPNDAAIISREPSSEITVVGNEGIRKKISSEKESAVSQPVANKRAEIFAVPQNEVPEGTEREMFSATCATCDIAISVPFKPVATRPTFCKDCLRDYQRAAAKVRRSIEGVPSSEHGNASSNHHSVAAPKIQAPEKRDMQSKRYLPSEAPMSLSQVQHIQPKTFKSLHKKSDVNLDDIRATIHTIRKQTPKE